MAGVLEFIQPMFIPFLIVLCSLFTLGTVHNGQSGELTISNKLKMYIPLYAFGSLILCAGLVHMFYTMYVSESSNLKTFYMYNLVFVAYVLASFSLYLSTRTVTLSLT